MLNPNKLFVTNTLSRAQIAQTLNEARDPSGSRELHLAEDDDRLTDEICQEIADWYGDNQIEFETSEDSWSDDEAEFLVEMLVKLGFTKND